MSGGVNLGGTENTTIINSLEDIINNLINSTNPQLVFGVGAKHKTSDKDITFLYLTKEEANKAYNESKKYIGILRGNGATLYFGTLKDYNDFMLNSYYVGQDGVGDDFGWGTLASTIKVQYMIKTKQIYYSKINGEEFFRNLERKLSNVVIPINEPYELYMTAKWGAFFDYLTTGKDYKLAKATLRLLYSLLAIDDGAFRGSYEEIVKDAPLVNMGRLFDFLGVSNYQNLLNKLLKVKEGKVNFTDEERQKIEGFFTIIGGFIDNYASVMNLFGNPSVKKRVIHYLKNKFEVYGGLDSIIKMLNDKLDSKNYSNVIIYITDLLNFVDVKTHKDFLENVLKMYKSLMPNKLPKEYHLSNYYKVKYLVGKLSTDDIEKGFNYIEEMRKIQSIYVTRAVLRKELHLLHIESDLYYYGLKIGYNFRDKFDVVDKMLLIDPINTDKILAAMDVYGLDYGVRNERVIQFLIHDNEREFPRKYRDILIKNLEFRKSFEISAINKHIEIREKTRADPRKLIVNWMHKNTKTLEKLGKETTSNIDSGVNSIISEISDVINGNYVNASRVVRELFSISSDEIFRSDLSLMEFLGVEHKAMLNATKIDK